MSKDKEPNPHKPGDVPPEHPGRPDDVEPLDDEEGGIPQGSGGNPPENPPPPPPDLGGN